MGKKFDVSKSNKALVIAGLIFAAYCFLRSDRSGYVAGGLFAQIFLPTLFAALIAWIAWLLSAKSDKVKAVTFNIVFILLLLGQAKQFSEVIVPQEAFKPSAKLVEMERKSDEYHKQIDNAKSIDEMDEIRQKIGRNAENKIKEITKASRGKQKIAGGIMSRWAADALANNRAWRKALSEVESETFLSLAVVGRKGEIAAQKKIGERYVVQATKSLNWYKSSVSKLEKQLRAIEETDEDRRHINIMLSGIKQAYKVQSPIYIPFMEAHIKTGNAILGMLDVLEKNRDQWVVENGQLAFRSDEVLRQYNKYAAIFQANGTEVDRLNNKLVQVMKELSKIRSQYDR